MIYCVNHKEVEAGFHCSKCELPFCEECVLKKEIEKARMRLCPRCETPLKVLDKYIPPVPAASQVGRIFAFPFSGYGLVFLLIWPLVSVIIRIIPVAILIHELEGALAIGTPAFNIIYYLLLLAVFCQLIERASQGTFEFRTLSSGVNLKELFRETTKNSIMPLFAVMWPAAICYMGYYNSDFAHSQSHSLHTLFFKYVLMVLTGLSVFGSVFFMPMAYIIISDLRNPWAIFNPLIIFAQIKKILGEYIYLFIGLMVGLSVYAGFRYIWIEHMLKRTVGSYAVWFLVEGMVHIFMAMVGGLLIGYVCFRNRSKFDWLLDSGKEEKIIIREGIEEKTESASIPRIPPGLKEKISKAAHLLEHGNYEGAAVLYDEIIQELPDDIDVLRGRVMAAFRVEDHKTIDWCGKKIGTQFAAEKAMEVLWDMYKDYRKTLPNFTFELQEMAALSAWLDGEGQYLEAARVLRELAVAFPDDEYTPEALYHCAVLLNEKCDKPDVAASILKTIEEKYPDSEFCERAKEEVLPPETE